MADVEIGKMKTELQIATFLKTTTPEQEVDELAIEQFCTKIHSSIKIKWGDPKSDMVINFQSFKKWFLNPAPEIGEIIVYDELKGLRGTFIAIVKCVCIDKIIAGAMVSPASGLVTHDIDVPSENYRPPTQEEVVNISQGLARAGFEWSYQYNRIVEKQKPSNGNYVRVTFLDGSKGLGVFDKIEDGEVHMYCIKLSGQQIRYSMNEVIGGYDEVFFDIANNVDKKILQQELNDADKLWNPYLKRIEPLNLRSEKGHKYFFLNDRLYVVQVHESLSNIDSKRFASGNYFRTGEEATKALAAIRKLLKIYHAKPESAQFEDD